MAQTADRDSSDVTLMEGDTRELAPRAFAANDGESLVQRVSGTALQEIERLIAELQAVRDMLHNEGERVHREIVQYATLSQEAMQSTKIIAEKPGALEKGVGFS